MDIDNIVFCAGYGGKGAHFKVTTSIGAHCMLEGEQIIKALKIGLEQAGEVQPLTPRASYPRIIIK